MITSNHKNEKGTVSMNNGILRGTIQKKEILEVKHSSQLKNKSVRGLRSQVEKVFFKEWKDREVDGQLLRGNIRAGRILAEPTGRDSC